jgi:hypothetical protein
MSRQSAIDTAIIRWADSTGGLATTDFVAGADGFSRRVEEAFAASIGRNAIGAFEERSSASDGIAYLNACGVQMQPQFVSLRQNDEDALFIMAFVGHDVSSFPSMTDRTYNLKERLGNNSPAAKVLAMRSSGFEDLTWVSICYWAVDSELASPWPPASEYLSLQYNR